MNVNNKLIFVIIHSFLSFSIPQALQAFDPAGTHIPALVTAVVNTSGPILELGCGDNSTPLLHAICAVNQRFLLSAENNLTFMAKFKYLQREWHQFQGTADWNRVGNNLHWSVVLIDHAPVLRRKIDIQRLRQQTEIFVVHDTELAGYQYEDVLRTFKYRYDYKYYEPYTTLVSDTIDVAALFQ